MKDCRISNKIKSHLTSGRGRGRLTGNSSNVASLNVNAPRNAAAAARGRGRGVRGGGNTGQRAGARPMNFVSTAYQGAEEDALLRYADAEHEDDLVQVLDHFLLEEEDEHIPESLN